MNGCVLIVETPSVSTIASVPTLASIAESMTENMGHARNFMLSVASDWPVVGYSVSTAVAEVIAHANFRARWQILRVCFTRRITPKRDRVESRFKFQRLDTVSPFCANKSLTSSFVHRDKMSLLIPHAFSSTLEGCVCWQYVVRLS